LDAKVTIDVHASGFWQVGDKTGGIMAQTREFGPVLADFEDGGESRTAIIYRIYRIFRIGKTGEGGMGSSQ
jgi:hypothetical protein